MQNIDIISSLLPQIGLVEFMLLLLLQDQELGVSFNLMNKKCCHRVNALNFVCVLNTGNRLLYTMMSRFAAIPPIVY